MRKTPIKESPLRVTEEEGADLGTHLGDQGEEGDQEEEAEDDDFGTRLQCLNH